MGHLRIVDHDTVGLNNLNRQILHSTLDLNRPKIESAAEKLQRLNPECLLEPVRARIGEDNGLDLAEGCDLVLDATDNPATRHVLNRISLARRIPLLYGGINGWNGTATTFVPGETGCFACLFPSKDLKTPATGVPALGSCGRRDRVHPERGSGSDIGGDEAGPCESLTEVPGKRYAIPNRSRGKRSGLYSSAGRPSGD